MSYCGECYYEGKKLKPCSTCYCGSEAKTELTNADRIRAMSDEELAEHFSELIRDTQRNEYCTGVGDWLQWLQSEAE